MQQRLPPLKALVAFESVVRTGSVTAAAEELFVTHSAVSKQIGALEIWIGERLFAENRRSMVPTPAAQQLADNVGMALKLIFQSLGTFSVNADTTPLRVIAPATFAMRWLLPKLPDFQALNESIRVRVRQTHTTENWHEMPFDLAIRRGGAVPPHLKSVPFFREELGLVCRPDLIDAYAGELPREIIGKFPLLKADTRPGELEEWLLSAAAPIHLASHARSFPHFYIALEASLGGQGALVAPIKVIEEILRKGDLIELDHNLRLKGPNYIALYDEAASEDSPAVLFATWLSTLRSRYEDRNSEDAKPSHTGPGANGIAVGNSL
ncbi:LysR family transcriptional regulator [Phyllobacterium zundukense]|nr:LysR family transcriptional regulator [Phyllobacterium zundukense]ATU95202.1 hypothetical protein BLM14_26040 [Phyllobacterium zundukense]